MTETPTNGTHRIPATEATPPALQLSREVIVACANQDIPSASAAELRAHVALIGARAYRVAVTTEYARLTQSEGHDGN